MKDYEHLYLKKLFHELNPVCATTGDYLYMANLYCVPRTAVFQDKTDREMSITGWTRISWGGKERMDVVGRTARSRFRILRRR
jgi:hypothetical protein